ncbi:MAG: MBOAT family O-acyltransferase [Lachnospiraceae bacterium]|nr:MBOAT family O-acyltransferase [Lachnospiraceae bacterium]
MLFSSISFLYYFLPCVLILYYIVPKTCRNKALLLVSLVFYAWGEPKFVFLMMGMVLFHYLAGILIGRYGQSKKAQAVLAGTLVVSIGTLCFYKFSNVAWPIGISFYTFQLISYVVDVYRQTAEPQKNLVNLGAYITMFPQLIAGPIVRYIDIEKQLQERTHNYEKTLDGIERFLIGLAKKILISNALGELCEIFKTSDEKSVVFFWVYAISYTLQIYFDFSGYSDMAIGLGKIFGFEFLENFHYPYISKSITEFWRRWHMSLGSWFRDYVYIPLGGNRVSKGRWYFNIFVVWTLTGLWHGAAPQFVVWGLLFAVLLVIEKHWLLKKLEKAKGWNHVYVLFFVIISFVIFNAADMAEAAAYMKGMFGFGNVPLMSAECGYYLKSYGILLISAVIGSTPIIKNVVMKTTAASYGKKVFVVVRPIVLLLILAVCTAYLIDSSFNPFLYFRF